MIFIEQDYRRATCLAEKILRNVMIDRRYIAVITDQHIIEPGSLLYGLDTNASAARVFEALKAEPLAELVLSLGDLGDTTRNPNRETATASKDSYQHVKHLTEGLTLPLLTVAGNHDDPKLMEAAFPNQWESQKNGVCRYSFHGVDLISVDVRTGPEATGFISPETTKELDETLAQCRGALIFSHFPLFDLDNERIASGLSVTNREVLAPIFDRHRDKIAGCFSGHLHIWVSALINGIPVTSVPSSSFGFSLEPMSSDRETLSAAPCGYLLVGVATDGSVIVRPRFLPGATRNDR